MATHDDDTTMISLQVPVKLEQALTRRAEKEGVSRSALIRDLLQAGLQRNPATGDRLKQIHDEVKALRREVGGLTKTMKRR